VSLSGLIIFRPTMHSSVHILILSKPMCVSVSIPETSTLARARTDMVALTDTLLEHAASLDAEQRALVGIAHKSVVGKYRASLIQVLGTPRAIAEGLPVNGNLVKLAIHSASRVCFSICKCVYRCRSLAPNLPPNTAGLYHKADPKQHAPLRAYATSLAHRVVAACERAIAAALRGLALCYAQPATAAAIHTAADNSNGGGGFAAESVVFFLKMYARGFWCPRAGVKNRCHIIKLYWHVCAYLSSAGRAISAALSPKSITIRCSMAW
jgi:hypothetical protein